MTVLVGRQAPDFTAAAVLANGDMVNQFTLSEALKNRITVPDLGTRTEEKYGLLFFYPLDFTFVCPSELIALDRRMEQFKALNVEVMAVSIDSQFTHNAWRNTPVEAGGIGPVGYTLVADVSHRICQAYGVEHPEAGIALRGAFVIDKTGVVRSQVVNDLPLGRNIDELLRTIEALQYHETHGEVCPAGWRRGDKAMHATPSGVASFLSECAGQL